MFARLVVVAVALLAAPAAFAQQSKQQSDAPPPLPLFYVSGGLAWSGEAGLEVEAGLQWDVTDALRLRFSPANVALIDGDLPEGFYLDGGVFGFGSECREEDTDDITFSDYCTPELDTEWRSVAEAQLRLAPGFHVGAGVSYLLQGDFRQEDGRVAPFASFSWDMDESTGLELRAGAEYMAFQIRGLW